MQESKNTMEKQGIVLYPTSFPPLYFEQQALSKSLPDSSLNPRYIWAEAELLIFSQLASRIRPTQTIATIRTAISGEAPEKIDYAVEVLEVAVTILENLAGTEMFAKLYKGDDAQRQQAWMGMARDMAPTLAVIEIGRGWQFAERCSQFPAMDEGSRETWTNAIFNMIKASQALPSAETQNQSSAR